MNLDVQKLHVRSGISTRWGDYIACSDFLTTWDQDSESQQAQRPTRRVALRWPEYATRFAITPGEGGPVGLRLGLGWFRGRYNKRPGKISHNRVYRDMERVFSGKEILAARRS